MTHNSRSGVAHFAAEDEDEALETLRQLLSYLPLNNTEDPPFVPTDDPADRQDEALNAIVPENPNKPYNMQRRHRAGGGRRRLFRDPPALRAEYCGGVCAAGRL